MTQDTLELTSETALREQAPKPEPVQLRTRRDYTLVATAVEHRKEELKKLAKKNEDEGYSRQAREVRQDAEALEYHVLPLLQDQRELPLAGHIEVRAAIADAIRQEVETNRAQKRTTEALVGELAIRIEKYGRAIAERAYEAGFAAREQEPGMLAMRSLKELRDWEDREA